MERETVNEQLTRDFPALGPLLEAAKTYRERRGAYGPSERLFGVVMHALYGDKDFTWDGVDDFVRVGLIVQIVGKLCRYVANPNKGHIDSAHDLGVYAFMLEAEDRRIQSTPPLPPVGGTYADVTEQPVTGPHPTYSPLYEDIMREFVDLIDDQAAVQYRARKILKAHMDRVEANKKL